MSQRAQKEIRRVVVRGTNWVGDSMMTVPALRELRRVLPEAHITLATRAWAKDLFADLNLVDEFMTYEAGGVLGTFSEARRWADRRFDLAVIFPNSFGSALVPALARIPRRIGYATDRRGFLLNPALPVPSWRESRHEAFYYLNVISELEKYLTGRATTPAPNSSIVASAQTRTRAAERLAAYGIEESDTLIALCPGSINSRAKRWPTESFAKLGDLLAHKLGAKVLLIGSNAEADVTLEVETRMKHRPVSLTGKTDLNELVGILNQVELLITNDTGPAHIAAALGRPTIVIFGPTNPLTTRPLSETADIIRKPPECAPCMLRDCPIDHRCMTAISPEEVFGRAVDMLEAARGPQRELMRAN
jgi:heptosyltransferase-2